MAVRIVLADDHQIMREGLRMLLEKEADFEVIAEADNGRQAVELCRKHRPDLVVMDVAMPDLNGMDATRQILADRPEARVLALSMYADRRYASGMLAAGAAGYVLKDAAFEELVRAIRAVLSGKSYLSPAVTEAVVEDYVHRLSDASSAFSVLTAREREVLQAMAEGKSTRQIAEALHISIKTVETHRQQIMNKLDIHSVAELTKYALREGLTSLDS
ncbi:MAG TPA: response regulator transcription factor [Armatimonadota bacterium]|jgi:DNA-binding NarL/FixJ family response regulator